MKELHIIAVSASVIIGAVILINRFKIFKKRKPSFSKRMDKIKKRLREYNEGLEPLNENKK